MSTTWTRLEKCLLPPPEILRWNEGNLFLQKSTCAQKIAHCVKNFFLFIALLLISPLTLLYESCSRKRVISTQKTFDIATRSPAWPPEKRGFATSLFQTCGLGTRYSAVPGFPGRADWDKHMADNPRHIEHPKGFDYRDFFTDVLSNPRPYVEMLKEHGATAHRFSFEWSILEPEPGKWDANAIKLYQNFISILLEFEISPSATLNHFVLPQGFYESGGFQDEKNIDRYVAYALKMMELFPQVTDWWSFNEIGVKGLQQGREVYPPDVPEGSSLSKRVYAAGRAMRSMVVAHCKLHQKVRQLHPNNKLRVTHQWLKFDKSTGNCLERLVAYVYTKFTFSTVYQFFKEGRFSFQFPFIANIQFEIPKEEFHANGHFLMGIGAQLYPKPLIKIGRNHGHPYPGLVSSIRNFRYFTFGGGTCEPGGTVTRFGPRWKAEAIDEFLDEAFELTPNVSISESGSDAVVWKWGEKGFALDETAQAEYVRQLIGRIHNYCKRTLRRIEGLFWWTDVTRQLEWENGHSVRLGTIHPIVNEQRQFIGYRSTPASRYLTTVFKSAVQEQARKAS